LKVSITEGEKSLRICDYWLEDLEGFKMEIFYFLIFIGVGAFAVVWAMRRSKTGTIPATKHTSTKANLSSDLLSTPTDSRLSHKEKMWETRREQARKGSSAPNRFIPKSEAAKEAQYDGYSRRDRHHLSATEHVKEEAHIEGHGDFSITSIGSDSKEHASQS
jgi:hypothetical protein